jgi:hypothetical protein
MEPYAYGRLGNSPKPDPGYNHHPEKAEEEGISIFTRSLQENFPTV